MNGVFISLEGGEGAGKSTMMARVCQWLREQGHDVLQTREPGGTELGEKIRAILLDKDHEEFDDLAELLLVFAARAQHLQQVIRPALADGRTVLCDRFTDASWAYQGGGRGGDPEAIAALENLVHGDLQPDLTILLDLPVETGMQRALGRGDFDRFEIESVAFFERVRSAYLARAEASPERFAVIDAAPEVETVWQKLEGVLSARLGPEAAR